MVQMDSLAKDLGQGKPVFLRQLTRDKVGMVFFILVLTSLLCTLCWSLTQNSHSFVPSVGSIKSLYIR